MWRSFIVDLAITTAAKYSLLKSVFLLNTIVFHDSKKEHGSLKCMQHNTFSLQFISALPPFPNCHAQSISKSIYFYFCSFIKTSLTNFSLYCQQKLQSTYWSSHILIPAIYFLLISLSCFLWLMTTQYFSAWIMYFLIVLHTVSP